MALYFKGLCKFLYGFLGYTCVFFFAKPALAQRAIQPMPAGSDVVKLYKTSDNSRMAFGGLSFKTTRINGIEGTMLGVRGSWRILGNFQVGVAGYKLINQDYNTRFKYDGHLTRLKTMYGGVEAGYSCNFERFIYLSFYTLVGLGTVHYSIEGGNIADLGTDYFYVVEPGVNLEMNMTQWFRVSVGASYRIAKGVDYYNLRDVNLTGLATTVSFKFGIF